MKGMRGKKSDYDPLHSSSNMELDDEESTSDYGNEFYEKLQEERRLLNEFGRIYGLDTQLPNDINSEMDYKPEEFFEEKESLEDGGNGTNAIED